MEIQASHSNAVSVTVAAGPPPVSPPGTLTATQLAKCPTVSGSNAQNFYLCMIGGLTGTQVFDPSKTCTLSISSAGATSVSSDGRTYSIPTYGVLSFTKSTYLLVQLNNPTATYPSIGIDLKSEVDPGRSFFVDGGRLQVDADSFDPRPTPTLKTSLSCVFTVPKN